MEKSLKLKEEELSSMMNKLFEQEEKRSRVSSELAGVHQQAEDGFKSIIAEHRCGDAGAPTGQAR